MDITFACDKCGRQITVDESDVGLQVHCAQCGQSLIVPKAADPKSNPSPTRIAIDDIEGGTPLISQPVTHNPKWRVGKVLGIVGLLFVLLAILFIKTHPKLADQMQAVVTHPKPADQMQAVVERFAASSSASADLDSLAFDVIPSPSGSLVSPYLGTVDYVLPIQVLVVATATKDVHARRECPVHIHALFAYQDGAWVFKELSSDVDSAGEEYLPINRQMITWETRYMISQESRDRLEQHRQRWQTATGR